MDFGNAAMLVAAIIGLVALVQRLVDKRLGYVIDDGETQLLAIGLAIGLLFLVGATVWGNTQVIGEHPLDKLGVVDKLFAGVMLGLASNFGDRVLRSVANIGENTTDPPR